MKAVIALGANIGDPKSQMDFAVAMLREALEVVAVSEYLSTKPVSDIEQPDYLNAICIAESELPAAELLALLHGIEKALGRCAAQPNRGIKRHHRRVADWLIFWR